MSPQNLLESTRLCRDSHRKSAKTDRVHLCGSDTHHGEPRRLAPPRRRLRALDLEPAHFEPGPPPGRPAPRRLPGWAAASERGVRLAQKMPVGPRITVGPIPGQTWRLSHLPPLPCPASSAWAARLSAGAWAWGPGFGRIVASEREAPNM